MTGFKNDHWVSVSQDTRFVSIGMWNDLDKALSILDVNLIKSAHYWGVMIADRDSGTHCDTVSYNDEEGVAKISCKVYGKEIILTVELNTKHDTFDITLIEID